jgi:hypothetical protein
MPTSTRLVVNSGFTFVFLAKECVHQNLTLSTLSIWRSSERSFIKVKLHKFNFTWCSVFLIVFLVTWLMYPFIYDPYFWHGIRHATLDVLCETVYGNTYPAGLGAQWHVHVLLPQRLPTIKCRTNILLESFLHVEIVIVTFSSSIHSNIFVFSVTVPYDNDVLYIAYHYPYTYSQLMVRSSLVLLFKCTQICFLLQTDVVTWLRTPFPIGYPSYSMDRLRISTLCRSPCGNPVPLLLIDYDGDAKVI